jgi:hypothetical protein
MDREGMIDVIVEDLEAYLKRDKENFWEHIRDLERRYLRGLTDKELAGLHEECK